MPVMGMFCKKCGKKSPKNSQFCEHCGEPLVAGEQAKSKKGRAKFWLIGAASVLFVMGLVVAIFFSEILIWAERNVLPPELLMKKALASAALDMGIGEIGSSALSDTPKRYTVGLYMDEDIQRFLSFVDENGGDWIEDLNLQIIAGEDEGINRVVTSLMVEDQSVISLDLLQDADKSWLGIPELNESYLEFSKAELSIIGLMDWKDYSNEMVEVFCAYAPIFSGCVQNVEKKNATLNVEGVTQNVLQLTASIPKEDAQDTFCRIAEKLKKDASAGELINDCFGNGCHEAAVEKLEGLAESITQDLFLVVYLDSQNALTGLEFTAADGQTLACWTKAVSKGKFASRVAFGNAVLIGNGTSVSQKQTADYCLRIDGKTVLKYKLKDFSIQKDGFTGSLIFPIEQNLTGASLNEEMCLELSQKTVSGNEVASLCFVMGEKALLGLTFTAEQMYDFSAQLPYETVPANDETVEKWLQSLDWESIPQQLTEAGVPVNVLGSLF